MPVFEVYDIPNRYFFVSEQGEQGEIFSAQTDFMFNLEVKEIDDIFSVNDELLRNLMVLDWYPAPQQQPDYAVEYPYWAINYGIAMNWLDSLEHDYIVFDVSRYDFSLQENVNILELQDIPPREFLFYDNVA